MELRMWVLGVKPWVLWLVGKLGMSGPRAQVPILDLFQSWGAGSSQGNGRVGKGWRMGKQGSLGFLCLEPSSPDRHATRPHSLQISAQKSFLTAD